MIIVGGAYREECQFPQWSRVFGSGGRAAAALSGVSAYVALHSYVARASFEDVKASLDGLGVTSNLTEVEHEIAFEYFHALSRPNVSPFPLPRYPPLIVTGDIVLRFGMLEAEAIVDAATAIYDPQGAATYAPFHANGSVAKRLTIVLNEGELLIGTGVGDIEGAIAHAFASENPDCLVVKRGAAGARVITRDGVQTDIPAFISDTVFKIGSGDVFSASFAYYWGQQNLAPVEAAGLASKCVAHYVGTRDAVLPAADDLFHGSPVGGSFGSVYVAGPFFDMAQRWLIEEACSALRGLKVPFFSPYHEVGMDLPVNETAEADLRGLREAAAVLAFIDGGDPGTLFEIGYARDRGIPVIAYTTRSKESDLTMVRGSGCVITSDFATAVYQAAWAAVKP